MNDDALKITEDIAYWHAQMVAALGVSEEYLKSENPEMAVEYFRQLQRAIDRRRMWGTEEETPKRRPKRKPRKKRERPAPLLYRCVMKDTII